jgi:hypothetical protein
MVTENYLGFDPGGIVELWFRYNNRFNPNIFRKAVGGC